MARIDLKNKVIQAKIVYYGPGLCGKTTNLEYVSRHLAGAQELMSLSTEGDRTIFFDFMPLNLGKLRGMDVQFKLYTVPGQVRYNETRKMVLKNVDCVVFVADSQELMMDANQESLDNLYANLKELGISVESTTIVLQYNKRDLPSALPVDVLDRALNGRAYPTFQASAMRGDGVAETLKEACSLTLNRLVQSLPEAERPRGTASSSRTPATSGAPLTAAQSPRPPNGGSTSKRLPPPQVPSAGRAAAAATAAPAATVPRHPPANDEPPLTAAQPEADPNGWLRAAIAELASTQLAMKHELSDLRSQVASWQSERAALEERLTSRARGDLGPLADKLDRIGDALKPLVLKADVERMEKSVQDIMTGPLARMEGGLGELGRQLRLQHTNFLDLATKEHFEQLDARLWAEFARLRSDMGERPVQSVAPTTDALEARLRDVPTKNELGAVAGELQGLGEQIARVTESIGQSSKMIEEHLSKSAREQERDDLRMKLAELPTKADVEALGAHLKSLIQTVADRAAASVPEAPNGSVAASAEAPLTSSRPTAEVASARNRVATERSWPPTERREEPGAEAPAPSGAEAAGADSVAPPVENVVGQTPPAHKLRPSRRPTAMLPVASMPPEAVDEPRAPAEASAGVKPAAQPAPAEREPEPEPAPAPVSPTPVTGTPALVTNDPAHVNASRVARVMVADLYLYNKDAVEEGIRNDDFFERNKEALADMRTTYESRIPEEVREKFDFLATAIRDFIAKKRNQLGSG